MALDWLKPILGEGYTAEVDTKIAQEIGKGFVALADFDAKEKELQQNKARYDADIASLRLDTAVDKALTEAGAKNNMAAKALLAGFLRDAKVKEDGSIRGLSSEIEALTKAEGTAFLFKTADAAPPAPPQIQGMKPGEAVHTGTAAGTQPHFEARLAEARKTGNNVDVIAVKREAAESGVILT